MTPEMPQVKPTDRSDKDATADLVQRMHELVGPVMSGEPGIDARVSAIDAFLDAVDESANKGEIPILNEKIKLEFGRSSYNLEDIRSQLSEFVTELNRQRVEGDPDPLNLIPRSNGLREAVNQLIGNELTTNVLLHQITEREQGARRHYGLESGEQLTSGASVQEELGGEAVKNSGIRIPEGMITKIPYHIMNPKTVTAEQSRRPEDDKVPFASLPEEVQKEIANYRLAARVKRESEEAGNYSQAARDGEEVYKATQRLSPLAREWLGIGL